MSCPLDGVLASDRILLRPPTADRFDLIRRMVAHLVSVGAIPSSAADGALSAVLAREEELATGLESGLAVPHGFCAGVVEPVAALAILETAVDFDALDGEPSCCVLLLVEPDTPEGRRRHLDFLGDVAEKWSQVQVRKVVMEADTAEGVLRALGVLG